MKEFMIDWRVGNTYSVKAETKEEAEDLFIDKFETILKDAVGWRLKGVEIEEIYEDKNIITYKEDK